MAEYIKIVSNDIDTLSPDIEEFVLAFTIFQKKYRYLCEILMNKLLELDKIDAGDDDNIRSLRKEEVDRIQGLLIRIDQCKFK
jgi:hypothetical protein